MITKRNVLLLTPQVNLGAPHSPFYVMLPTSALVGSTTAQTRFPSCAM